MTTKEWLADIRAKWEEYRVAYELEPPISFPLFWEDIPHLLELVELGERRLVSAVSQMESAQARELEYQDKVIELQQRVREPEQHFSDEANAEHMPTAGDFL